MNAFEAVADCYGGLCSFESFMRIVCVAGSAYSFLSYFSKILHTLLCIIVRDIVIICSTWCIMNLDYKKTKNLSSRIYLRFQAYIFIEKGGKPYKEVSNTSF